MNHSDLCDRTKTFAVSVAKLARSIGGDPPSNNAAVQLARASGSVAANYRAAGLARSRKEFISKLGVVIEEADECVFWLEYVGSLPRPGAPAQLGGLLDESRQLVKIFTAARNTARRNARQANGRVPPMPR